MLLRDYENTFYEPQFKLFHNIANKFPPKDVIIGFSPAYFQQGFGVLLGSLVYFLLSFI